MDRAEAIMQANRDQGHTQMAITAAAALSVSRVGQMIAALEAEDKT